MSKIVFGMRPDVRIVGLPAGCVGAVVRMANAAGAVIRLEFADRAGTTTPQAEESKP